MLTIEDLFPPGCFGLDDIWLRPRVHQLMAASFSKPDCSFGSQLQRHADVQGAYRLCSNPSVTLDSLLAPALSQVGAAIGRGDAGTTVLSLQDTTQLNLSHLEMEGLGEQGNPDCQGLFVHSALACTATGLPFGLLGVRTWVRDPKEHGKGKQRRVRSFEEKEVSRWWEMMEQTETLVGQSGRLLHVFDREGDVFAIFSRATARGFRMLVRAAQDRRVDGPQSHLWATVESFRPSGQRTVWLPARPAVKGKPARAGREATLTLRFGSVMFKAPTNGSEKGSDNVRVWAIQVSEEGATDVADPIDWMLLTTDELSTTTQAWQHVEWYLKRWRHEEFHKALKTGCRVESRQFESRHNLENAMAFMLLTSVRCLTLRDLSREEPERPADTTFNADELVVINAQAKKRGLKVEGRMTLATAVMLVATMGGFLGRKSDGVPGWQTLWQGYVELQGRVEGYRIALDALRDSSTPPSGLASSLPLRPDDPV